MQAFGRNRISVSRTAGSSTGVSVHVSDHKLQYATGTTFDRPQDLPHRENPFCHCVYPDT